jgi:hypothetical protein
MSDGHVPLSELTPEEYVEMSWQAALTRVLDELEYNETLDSSVDEHGCIRPSICTRMFSAEQILRLTRVIRVLQVTLPFPTLDASCMPANDIVGIRVPTVEHCIRFCYRMLCVMPDVKTFRIAGYDADDQIEIQARAIAFRSEILRIVVELMALQLMLLKREQDRRLGRPIRYAPYRAYLERATAQVYTKIAA